MPAGRPLKFKTVQELDGKSDGEYFFIGEGFGADHFHKAENRTAIGQILDYGREFTDPKKELMIITTLFDVNTAKTIQYYNLPIRYIYMDKSRTLQDYRTIDG